MANKYELKNAVEEKGLVKLQFELAESDPFAKLPKDMEFSLSRKMLSGLMGEPKSSKPAETKKASEPKPLESKKDSDSKNKKD